MSEVKTERTLQAILEVLERIDCKMDSIETAATRDNKDYDYAIQRAFDEGAEFGAKEERDEEDDEPETVTAPELENTDNFIKRELQDKLDAQVRLDDTASMPSELSVVSGTSSPTQTRFMCFCARMLTFVQPATPEQREIVCECGKVWSWVDGEGVYKESEIKGLIRQNKELSEKVARLEKEAQELEEVDSCRTPKPSSFTQWLKDLKKWRVGIVDDTEATNLLWRAKKMIDSLKRDYKDLEAEFDVEEKHGLQRPPFDQPADGSRFIIQFTLGGNKFVQESVYRCTSGRNCFEILTGIIEAADVEALMPFPDAVKVDRSESRSQ